MTTLSFCTTMGDELLKHPFHVHSGRVQAV